MDMVLGDEHTSNPTLLVDVNDDGPLRLSPSPTPTVKTLSSPSNNLAEDESSGIEKQEQVPFSSGRRLKNKRNKTQDEDTENKEIIAELLREKIDDDKKTRSQVADQTNELLTVMKMFVNHVVKEE